MDTKRAALPPEEQVSKAVATLRSQKRRHLEAVAEIDEALRQLGEAGAEGDSSAEDPRFREALEQVNQTYGDVLRRLA